MGNRMLGDLFMMLDRSQEALQHYQAGIDSEVKGFWTYDNMFRVGLALAKTDRTAEGLDLLYQSLALTLDSGLDTARLLIQFTLGLVYAKQEDWMEVDKILESLLENTEARSFGLLNKWTQLLLGRKLSAEGDHERALEIFQQVARWAAKRAMTLLELQAWELVLKTGGKLGREYSAASRRREFLHQDIVHKVRDEELQQHLPEFHFSLIT